MDNDGREDWERSIDMSERKKITERQRYSPLIGFDYLPVIDDIPVRLHFILSINPFDTVTVSFLVPVLVTSRFSSSHDYLAN